MMYSTARKCSRLLPGRNERDLHVAVHPQILARGVANHRRRQLVVEVPHGEHLLHVLTILVLRHDLAQEIPVLLTVRLEVPQKRRADVNDLPRARTVRFELLDLFKGQPVALVTVGPGERRLVLLHADKQTE